MLSVESVTLLRVTAFDGATAVRVVDAPDRDGASRGLSCRNTTPAKDVTASAHRSMAQIELLELVLARLERQVVDLRR
jgi:hypothetical protein